MKRYLTIGIILAIALAAVAMPAAAMKPTIVHKATGSGTLIQTTADLLPDKHVILHNIVANYAFTAQQDPTGRISGHTTITLTSPGGDKWTFKGDVSYIYLVGNIAPKIGMIAGTITTASVPWNVGKYYVMHFVDGQPDAAVVSVYDSEQAFMDWVNGGNPQPAAIPLTSGSITIV